MNFLESWIRLHTCTTHMQIIRFAQSRTSSTLWVPLWATRSMDTVRCMTLRKTSGRWLQRWRSRELEHLSALSRTTTSSLLEAESIKNKLWTRLKSTIFRETLGRKFQLQKWTNLSGFRLIWDWPTRSLTTRSFSSEARVLLPSTFSTDASFSMWRRCKSRNEVVLSILAPSWTLPWYSITICMPTETTFMYTSTTFQSRNGLSFQRQASFFQNLEEMEELDFCFLREWKQGPDF